jgi:hypothetical protein
MYKIFFQPFMTTPMYTLEKVYKRKKCAEKKFAKIKSAYDGLYNGFVASADYVFHKPVVIVRIKL